MTDSDFKESSSLLGGDRFIMGKTGKQGVHNKGYHMDIEDVVIEKEYWEDDFNEEQILFADGKKRGNNLIWNDFAMLTVEYLQWLALIQSLALRWPWPQEWLKNMSWIFAFNLDIWEIVKVSNNDTYKSVQEFTSDSSLMPFAYWNFLVALFVVLVLLLLGYVIAYNVMSQRDDPYLMVKVANMQRAYIIIFQILALPLGVAMGKVFHCLPDSKGETLYMYVDNTQTCFSSQQWAYVAASIAIAIPYFILFPVWLIRKTKLELIFSNAAGHEAYLQLKETEYVQGLDVVYIVSGFHVFSSFKLKAAHFRAAMHLLKFGVVILYASLINYNFLQTLLLGCTILLYFVAFAIQRPFRVSLFNGMLALNTLFLALNLITGVLRTSFDAYSLRSVWFTPTYTFYVIIAVNGVWLFVTLAALVYLLLHQFNVIHKPIWPTLTSDGVEKLDENTKKFMKGVLRARHIIERSMSLPPLFAPAHELSRQIQIINSYCREAELLDDPLQDTLWHLLDELIEVHSQIAPRSLFSESVKDSIRTTAADLMRIMPMFVKRLAQREYDMLLISPVKRRILLKMYCMGMFLNGRSKKVELNKMNQAAMNKLWSEERVKTKQSVDHIGKLQPEREIGPRVGDIAFSAEPLHEVEVMSLDDDYLSLTDDEPSIDVDAMVAGIPNRSALVSRATITPPRSSTRRPLSTSPVAARSTTGVPDGKEESTEATGATEV